MRSVTSSTQPRRRRKLQAIGLIGFVLIDVIAIWWAFAPSSGAVGRNATSAPSREAEAASEQTALFIGDSYTTGSRASEPSARWTSKVAAASRWQEINEGRGGTGYISTSDRRGCGRDYCPTYQEVIESLSGLAPEIVVISGGRNDGQRAPADYERVVESTLKSASAKWPQAEIIVTSPIWDDEQPSWAPEMAQAVKTAADKTQATYVDLGQPLLGHPEYLSADSIHPNDAGYEAIAQAFLHPHGEGRSIAPILAVAGVSAALAFGIIITRWGTRNRR